MLTREQNKYGRTIADVLLADGSIVNQKLVKEGFCVVSEIRRPTIMPIAAGAKKLSAAYGVILLRSRTLAVRRLDVATR